MEQRFTLGQAGGVLTVHEEGLRAVFEADMPDDRQGLYKVHVAGAGGGMLLGTLMPESGRLHLRRSLPVGELRQKGCWPVTKGEAKIAFHFEQSSNSGANGCPPGWHREENPAQLMGDRILARAAGQTRGMLLRREEGGFSLAVPFDQARDFPLTPLFCFARVEHLGQRPYAIFKFNGHGCPIF